MSDETVGEPQGFRKGLSRRQRREMGLTFLNIRRIAKAGIDSGELTKDTDLAVASAFVIDKLVGENPQAFGDPSVDWDAILAFVEAILEIVMKFILMF